MVGIVIGNALSEIEIYESKEVISEKETNIYTRTETTKFGIALQGSEIFRVTSELLGSTIYEHLSKYALIK